MLLVIVSVTYCHPFLQMNAFDFFLIFYLEFTFSCNENQHLYIFNRIETLKDGFLKSLLK